MPIKLVTPKAYVRQATAAIQQATTRVHLIAMVIADHDATNGLIEALQAAAKRGVHVSVAADVITYGEVTGRFLPLGYYSPSARQATAMARKLKAAGVRFHWLGHGRVTILNGRTHSKWCVVDDTCFVFGGVNMYQEGIEHVDYMFRLENSRLADRLVHEQRRIQRAERSSTNYPSVGYEFDNHTVLFDGGIMGHSIIYRRVLELCSDAAHITFVSQYCPTGKLARALKRSPDHTIYFNRPEQAKGVNRVLIRLNMWLTGLTTQYQRAKYIHAKFIIFTKKDGTKVAITGSHNFAYAGVFFGTREVALETSDPAIISQLEDFLAKKIA